MIIKSPNWKWRIPDPRSHAMRDTPPLLKIRVLIAQSKAPTLFTYPIH